MQVLAWSVVAVAVLVGIGAMAPPKPAKDARSSTTPATSAPIAATAKPIPTTNIDSDEAAIAAGKLALCQDGNYSDNAELSKTCSGGKGVVRWLATYGRCADGAVIVMKSTSSCSGGSFGTLLPGFQPAPGPKDLARCVNGLFSDNRELVNTCSGNDGLAAWLAPFGRCVDRTVVRMSASDACSGHGGFGELEVVDFVPTAGPLDIAKCKDGTFSSNRKVSATCSSRGGVESWLATYGACDTGRVVQLAVERCDSGRIMTLLPDYVPTTTASSADAGASDTPATTGPAGGGEVTPELLDVTFEVLMEMRGIDKVAAKSAAKSFCRAIDANGGDVTRTMVQAAVIITAGGMSPELIGTVIGAGVPAYCPQYSDALNALSGG